MLPEMSPDLSQLVPETGNGALTCSDNALTWDGRIAGIMASGFEGIGPGRLGPARGGGVAWDGNHSAPDRDRRLRAGRTCPPGSAPGDRRRARGRPRRPRPRRGAGHGGAGAGRRVGHRGRRVRRPPRIAQGGRPRRPGGLHAASRALSPRHGCAPGRLPRVRGEAALDQRPGGGRHRGAGEGEGSQGRGRAPVSTPPQPGRGEASARRRRDRDDPPGHGEPGAALARLAGGGARARGGSTRRWPAGGS